MAYSRNQIVDSKRLNGFHWSATTCNYITARPTAGTKPWIQNSYGFHYQEMTRVLMWVSFWLKVVHYHVQPHHGQAPQQAPNRGFEKGYGLTARKCLKRDWEFQYDSRWCITTCNHIAARLAAGAKPWIRKCYGFHYKKNCTLFIATPCRQNKTRTLTRLREGPN